jgi:hypothetical protein
MSASAGRRLSHQMAEDCRDTYRLSADARRRFGSSLLIATYNTAATAQMIRL